MYLGRSSPRGNEITDRELSVSPTRVVRVTSDLDSNLDFSFFFLRSSWAASIRARATAISESIEDRTAPDRKRAPTTARQGDCGIGCGLSMKETRGNKREIVSPLSFNLLRNDVSRTLKIFGPKLQ